MRTKFNWRVKYYSDFSTSVISDPFPSLKKAKEEMEKARKTNEYVKVTVVLFEKDNPDLTEVLKDRR